MAKTKTTGEVVEIIQALPEEPALCPVLHLYCYTRMNLNLGVAITEELQNSAVWWSTTQQSGQYRPLASADPIGKDTLAVMERAGVDVQTYSAHALRGAAATKYVDKGATADSGLTLQ